MGLFAPPAAYLLGWVGARGAVGLSLGLIAVFGVGRALVPGTALVIAATFPVGIGMGLAGALLPVAVKQRFPDRPAFATGVYTTGIQLGSALSAAASVPLAGAVGGWRASLLTFSALTGCLVGAWLVLTRRGTGARPDWARPPRLPWRSGLAWLLALLFGLMGLVYYGINSWLPDSYVERGWSEGRAGALLAVLNVAALSSSLAVPWLADRHGSRRTYLVSLAALLALALTGLVLVPAGGYAWAAVVGLAIGALFPLVLTLPLDLSRTPAEVGALVGMMLGGGYVLA
ncbi:MAG: MFS transporter, partial [Actinobacteria bacterium]|nr:MFS transporter [Actinomycetota bacterium]